MCIECPTWELALQDVSSEGLYSEEIVFREKHEGLACMILDTQETRMRLWYMMSIGCENFDKIIAYLDKRRNQ